jgi:uncharacterized membrane-anchored protein YitT (DUF2179 family)
MIVYAGRGVKEMAKFRNGLAKAARLAFAYAAITAGCALMAASFPLFFLPCRIAPGGFSGIAQILNHFFGWNVGAVNFALCMPLFAATARILDWKAFVRNLYGTAAFSFFIDFFSFLPPASGEDLFLAAIFGGVLMGAGCGLAYRFSASTGGSDLAALLIARKGRRVSAGAALLVLDGLVVAAAGAAFRSIELSLYAFVAVYIATKAIDFVADGPGADKAFYIFTQETEKVKAAVLERLNRGLTVYPARGGYTGQAKEVLFAVVGRRQAPQLKAIIREIDPKAFVILLSAHEVLGEGFANVF